MTTLLRRLPQLSWALLAAFLALTAGRGLSSTTVMLIAGSLAMFGCCWASATHLLGGRAARRFVAIGVVAGWIAEQLGASHGWFFGHYTYTEVLGPRLGDVPIIIPLMWFALCYIGYVLANLIVWQTPADDNAGLTRNLALSVAAAMIVTAYDLGADPYMVYVLKAWIMEDTHGWWFGETVQGFGGWMLVSFTIIFLFRLTLRGKAPAPALPVARRDCLVPFAIYFGNLAFQVCLGYPVETRTVAVFAMGLPLLLAACGYERWQPTARPLGD